MVPINRRDELALAYRLDSQGTPQCIYMCVCVCRVHCTDRILNKCYITLTLRAVSRGNSTAEQCEREREEQSRREAEVMEMTMPIVSSLLGCAVNVCFHLSHETLFSQYSHKSL